MSEGEKAPTSRGGQRLKAFLPFAVVAIAALFSAATLKMSGFRALSDDDYSRVTIAQSFARMPSLDPSRTSWLPFPFWALGASFRAAGDTLGVARATAFALSLLGAFLLVRAAGHLGLRAINAGLVVAALLLLPTLRPLAMATVPEFLCHASLTFAIIAFATRKDLVWGAIALCSATLSRYETWPAAFALSSLASLAALRTDALSRTRLTLLAIAGVVGPLAWSVYGYFYHGSFTFYVKRVVAYKRALGIDPREGLDLFASVPRALVAAEPTVTALGVIAIALFYFERRRSLAKPPLFALLLPAVALVTGLILGDVRGGAPTHHPERTLAVVWMLLSLLAGLYADRHKRSRLLPLLAVVMLVARAAGVHDIELSGSRVEEEEAGDLLRAKLPSSENVVIATTDYGYFAIMAAAGNPARFTVLDTHDPRQPSVPLPIPPRVIAAAERSGSCYALLPLCVEMEGIARVAETSAFTLARLTRKECAGN